MRILSQKPGPPLDVWVRSVWYFEGRELEHDLERVIPDGCMQLLVNLVEDELRWWDGSNPGKTPPQRVSGGAVSGSFSAPIAINTAEQRAITGVTFVPGGAAAFLGVGAHDFANKHVAFSDLPALRSLRDRLLETWAIGSSQVLDTWMNFLNDQFNPQRLEHVHIARRLLEDGLKVQETADAMSISVRKLRHDFRAAVGLSPKKYARIHRLQCLLEDIAADATTQRNWADLAHAYGYYDQAHFAHGFSQLTGVAPAAYRPRHADDWNHMIVV